MGMRVGGAASSAAMSSWQTRQQDFGNLVSAIKSGNLSSAQQAFSALQALGGSAGTGTTTGTTTGATATTGSTSNSNSPLAAIGQALSSGDISGAQQALANAFNGSGHGGHHHHHHGGGSSTNTAAATTLPTGTTVSTMA